MKQIMPYEDGPGPGISLVDWVKDLLTERKYQIDEHFRLLEDASARADVLLAEYKRQANQLKESFLPRAEYLTHHEQLVEKLDTELSALRKDITEIRGSVMTLQGRSGYLSSTLVVAIAAIVVSLVLHFLSKG